MRKVVISENKRAQVSLLVDKCVASSIVTKQTTKGVRAMKGTESERCEDAMAKRNRKQES